MHACAMVESIEDKMGQGLVGEFQEGGVKTEIAIPPKVLLIWEYKPLGKPKKVSLYVDLHEMADGDHIAIFTVYYIKGVAVTLDLVDFCDFRFPPAKLILDQLPVATKTRVYVAQQLGAPFTVHYQVIIEEL